MGCGSSRPSSARSWMAVDGWVAEKEMEAPPPTRSGSGKVKLPEDGATEKEKTGEESLFNEPQTRQFEGGSVGISNTDAIRKRIDELEAGELLTDEEFGPDQSSLFFSEREDSEIEWLRPQDISSSPHILVNGISRDDIMQGTLGDCWFLSSCAAIAQNPELMKKTIPAGQVLSGEEYKGAVNLRFWRFGSWVDVFVDDLLPTKEGKLIYGHNTDSNEFWVSLLEKAYAKLHGSYEAIEGGQAMDALVDLTGGLAERYELAEHTKELFQKLARALGSGAFITCSRKGDWKTQHNQVDEFGLIAGHAYTVTDVKRIKRKNGAECLLRIRNPWGLGEEWKGAWCDSDHRWELVDEDTKKWLQFIKKDDGEFWMNYKDFTTHFQEVTICTVGPDFDGDGEVDKVGKILMVRGQWIPGVSAGGCRNDINAFATNPQFLLTVDEPDEEDGSVLKGEEPRETCSVLVSLLQEHRRSQRHVGVKMLQIGFLIYETDYPDERLPSDHFMYNYETAKSGTYVNFREVCGRFELYPGHYILIPTTYNKDEEGSFLLRVYAAKSITLENLADFDPTDEVNAPSTRMSNMEEGRGNDLIPPTVISTPTPSHPYGGEDYDSEIAAAMDEIDDGKERKPRGE